MGQEEKDKREKTVGKSLNDLNNPDVREEILGGLPDPGAVEVPDFAAMGVKPMTDEEQQKLDEEFQHRREVAHAAGEKIAEIELRFKQMIAPIELEIRQIESDPEKLELIPGLRERLKELKTARDTAIKARENVLDQLATEDEGVSKHIEFATLLDLVRKTEPRGVRELLFRAVKMGRLRETKDTQGKSNILYYQGRAFEPVPDMGGKVTPATMGLVAEFRKKIAADRQERRSDYDEAVETLKTKADPNFSLARIVYEDPVPVVPEPVLVHGYLPKREEVRKVRREGGKIEEIPQFVPESHFLVEYDGEEIRPVEAAGRLRKFWEDLVAKNDFITVQSLRKNRLILEKRLPEETLQRQIGFLRILRAAAALEKTAVENAAAPPPAELEEEAEVINPPVEEIVAEVEVAEGSAVEVAEESAAPAKRRAITKKS